jgi:flavin reductase (DIM6/NTAB) family NADH-FMN oxidoreductase RutF
MIIPDDFKTINPEDLLVKPINLIGNEWMLITAGTKGDFNTMTAAWGGIGFLWRLPVTYIFVRPQRYTYHFTEKYDAFTLSFFDKKYKDILTYCGIKSGRDVDKIKETGLKPLETSNGNIYFQQSKLVIECRKLYYDDINPEKFIDQKVAKVYPEKDYHRMYICEIISCLIKK